MRKFFRSPPSTGDDFFELFHLIWDQGIGNAALPDGLCGEKWTIDSMIAAFENAGASISDRSIEEWRRRKFVPGAQNLRVLIAIVSDARTGPAWRDLLMSAARQTRERRKAEEEVGAIIDLPAGVAAPAAPTSTAGDKDLAPESTGRHTNENNRISLWRWALGVTVAMTGIVGGASWMLQPRIADIRICDVQNFSVASQRCSRHMQTFPAGTRRVYVSFDLLNYPQDKPFTRTWFLNGRKMLERQGLLAAPWDGWTWYGASDPDSSTGVPIDNGNYTFRVSADAVVESVAFVVGVDRPLAVGQRFKDRFSDDSREGPQMVVIPSGHFLKGSPETTSNRSPDEGPQHSISINYRWAISVHEVTWDEWLACVDDGGCNGYVPIGRGQARGDQPVVNVSYNDVFAYTHWLNKRLGIAQERFDRYTLLSESEWEYAALAGSQGDKMHPYSFGPAIDGKQARFRSMESSSDGPREVGAFEPNTWGLYDMHGNVAELVEDCYRPMHDRTINDGSAYLEAACQRRVAKGGSFADDASKLRVAARQALRPEDRREDVGFRLARRLEAR